MMMFPAKCGYPTKEYHSETTAHMHRLNFVYQPHHLGF